MEGADGAYCHGGQLCAAWNKCFTAAAPGDLVKKVTQKCDCPFVLFLSTLTSVAIARDRPSTATLGKKFFYHHIY